MSGIDIFGSELPEIDSQVCGSKGNAPQVFLTRLTQTSQDVREEICGDGYNPNITPMVNVQGDSDGNQLFRNMLKEAKSRCFDAYIKGMWGSPTMAFDATNSLSSLREAPDVLPPSFICQLVSSFSVPYTSLKLFICI